MSLAQIKASRYSTAIATVPTTTTTTATTTSASATATTISGLSSHDLL